MFKKSKIYDVAGIRSFETFFADIPPKDKAKCLKVFINEAGIVRRQLPTESKENVLLNELNRLMKKPIPLDVLNETKALLAADRKERAMANTQYLFDHTKDKGISLSHLWFGKDR